VRRSNTTFGLRAGDRSPKLFFMSAHYLNLVAVNPKREEFPRYLPIN